MNSVLPDGALAGSIWDGKWRTERAATYGIEPEGLEEHCRYPTTLKVNVVPEDIAEAIAFFVGPSAKDHRRRPHRGRRSADGLCPIASPSPSGSS